MPTNRTRRVRVRRPTVHRAVAQALAGQPIEPLDAEARDALIDFAYFSNAPDADRRTAFEALDAWRDDDGEA